MRITTLVENRASPDDPQLVAEWGLSQCVEMNGRRLLFDLGASDAFARNAARLGIDIAAIDAAILSHHHCDHGGGLRRFLELNHHAPVYPGAAPAGDPTVKLLGFVRKYVGLDRTLLATHAPRFRFVQERTEVLPGVFVLPRIGGHHPRPSGNKALLLRQGKALAPDDFRHEVVVAREFPGVPVKAVVGGFHLAALPPFRGVSESALRPA